MSQKIIMGSALAALLFAGVILAQNTNPDNQFNVNMGDTLTNTNSAPENKPKPLRNSSSCFRLSLSDAEKILGARLEFWYEQFVDEENTCGYHNYGGPDARLESAFKTYSTVKKAREIFRLKREISELKSIANADSFKYRAVTGIGSAAWIKTGDRFQEINVRKGKTIFNITTDYGLKMSLPELKRVARKTAGKF